MAVLIENNGLVKLVDLINWSSDMNTPLVGGGLLNHTNYYFECYKTVVGEQRAIENESMERSKNKSASTSSAPAAKNKLGRH